jgi:hypothetical protein
VSGWRETDLAPPLQAWLRQQGYTVRSEVQDCDLLACRADELVAIELKRHLSTGLLIQATQRQKAADSVYLAVPQDVRRRSRREWAAVKHLLRRLELGLLLVDPEHAAVEVVLHPEPFDRRRDQAKRRALLTEVAGRSADDNLAGSHRRKLVTAYRERALLLALLLSERGPSQPRELRAAGADEKTLPVLAGNAYGWFQRVARGVYALTPQGEAGLAEYPAVVERCRQRLAGAAGTTPPSEPVEPSGDGA